MRLLVIQHDHVSPLGPIAERFEWHGFDVEPFLVVPADEFAHPGVTVTFPDVEQYDAVVTMGAKWSTYDLDLVGSWVGPELELLARADRASVPVLGICFGGQLLATAHGGEVQAAETPEIGWAEVATDRPDLVGPGPWFEWHFDRWALPPAATEVARNRHSSQAFVLRANLAVQFHPELTPAMLDGWLDNGGDQALAAAGVSRTDLAAATRAQAPAARRRAHALVDGFLTRPGTLEASATVR